MTSSALDLLNQSELIELALSSGQQNDAGFALAYLKEAVSRTDATGISHFLLGSEYAQLHMYDRAIVEMESALALDPSLKIARFQLGLLLLSTGDGIRSIEVLEQLTDIEQNEPLLHFAHGLIYLIKDNFSAARESLSTGIVLNKTNIPLNKDMQRLIDGINQLESNNVLSEVPTEESSSRHIFISAYTDNRKA